MLINGIGVRSTALLAFVGLMTASVTMMLPEPAQALEQQIEAAKEVTRDLAVTEKPLEEVQVPAGYTDSQEVSVDEVNAEETLISSVDSDNSDQTPEESTLARALISSSTAVLGVSFPHGTQEEALTFSYRARRGETWTAWEPMEVAEDAEASSKSQQTRVGTEPLFLVDVDEVEVSVTTTDGRSVSGAQLTVIEPELTPAELPQAQRDIHGDEAVQAVESLTDDRHALPLSTVQESAEVQSQLADTETNTDTPVQDASSETLQIEGSETPTPAELAEKDADITVPLPHTGQMIAGAPLNIRTQGMSNDGRSYITNLPGLTINTRKAWGANESWMDWDPEKVTFKGAVVHHTAGSNNYTKDQVPGVIQGVYRYHAVTLGWGDIGYHLIVDKFGGVWEGRAGGLTKMNEGGHAYGANKTTFGISVLGDYMKVKPSNEAIDAVAKAVAWKLNIHGIKNLNATFTTKGNQWGKESVTLPVVSAHRQVGGTTCPGDAFMTRWDELIAKVKSYSALLNKPASVTSAPEPPKATLNLGSKTGQWDAKKHMGTYWHSGVALYAGNFAPGNNTSALLADKRGNLWLYKSANHSAPHSRTQIGTYWTNLDQLNAGVDFDGDKIPDIVGRLKSNGNLLLYSGDGRGSYKYPRKIGTGWGGFSSVYVVGQMDGGKPAVYAVDSNGLMRVYHTDGRGNFTTSERIGSGWNNMRGLSGVGDKTGNGAGDMLAVDQYGKVWIYEGKGNGRFFQRVQVASGWGMYEQIRSAGDNGHIWTVTRDGYFTHHNLKAIK